MSGSDRDGRSMNGLLQPDLVAALDRHRGEPLCRPLSDRNADLFGPLRRLAEGEAWDQRTCLEALALLGEAASWVWEKDPSTLEECNWSDRLHALLARVAK